MTVACATVLAVAIGLVACSGNQQGQAKENPPVDASLGAIASGRSETPSLDIPDPTAEEPGSLADLISQSALDLSSLDAPAGSRSSTKENAAHPTVTITRQPADGGSDVQPIADPLAQNASQTPDAPTGNPAGDKPKTIEQQIDRLSAELVSLLDDRAADARATLGDLVRAELVRTVLTGEGGGIQSDIALAPGERAVLDTVRSLAAGLTSEEVLAGDPDALADALDRASGGLTTGSELRVSDLALCTRVAGYGQYDALPSSALAAGRSHRLIVYAEVDRFAHRPASGGEWAVDLAQTLQLFHDADGAYAWGQPEQTVLTTSRRKIRDLYITSPITLPATLSIGLYQLKVVMKDKTTGAVAERTIPIRIVTDAALALEGQ
jgi:hypothetical protein